MTSPRLLRLAAVAAGAALLAFSAGCKQNAASASAPAATPAAPPALPVTAIEAKTEQLPIGVEAVGRAEGSREVEIRARVSGILEKRLYDEGTAVPAGKVLFIIDPKPYQLAVEQARAALLQAQARASLARAEAKRLRPLADEKAISQRELDTALATEQEAVATEAGAEAALKQAQLNLSYTQVTAPIAGLTGRALVSEGSLVSPNDASGLLTTMTQVKPIWVRFSIAQQDFDRIRKATRGAQVQMIGDDGSVLADKGALNFAANTVDAQTGTVQLRAEFPNLQREWLPGQFIKVRVLAGEQAAIRVPQSALVQAEGSRAVMIVGADGKAAMRPVQASDWVGGDALVTAGLNPGDRVIVDNLVKVRPGAPVQVKAPQDNPAAAPAPASAPKPDPAAKGG